MRRPGTPDPAEPEQMQTDYRATISDGMRRLVGMDDPSYTPNELTLGVRVAYQQDLR